MEWEDPERKGGAPRGRSRCGEAPTARASKRGGRVLQNRVPFHGEGWPGRPGWLLLSQRIIAVALPYTNATRGIIIPAHRIRVWSTYEINAARMPGATVGGPTRSEMERSGATAGAEQAASARIIYSVQLSRFLSGPSILY